MLRLRGSEEGTDFYTTTDISDLDLVERLSDGKVDLTYGRYIPLELYVIHLSVLM